MNGPFSNDEFDASSEEISESPVAGRIESALVSGIARRRRHRRRAALSVGAISAVGVVVLVGGLLGSGPVGGGPEPALAIETHDDFVALTITDPSASDEQMNAELAAAGIDRVRVLSVPGPAGDVGSWWGQVDIGVGATTCIGGAWFFGTGIEIPTIDDQSGEGHPSSLVEMTIPRDSGALEANELLAPLGGDTARVRVDTVTDPDYSAEILVAIRPDSEAGSSEIGAERLSTLGGQFAAYATALDDGVTSCAELDMSATPTFSSNAAEREWFERHYPEDAPVPPPLAPETALPSAE